METTTTVDFVWCCELSQLNQKISELNAILADGSKISRTENTGTLFLAYLDKKVPLSRVASYQSMYKKDQ